MIKRPSTTASQSTFGPSSARRELDLFALPEGSATVICGEGARDVQRWLLDVDGVEGTARFELKDPGLECCFAWSLPGRAFGFAEMGTERGTHGGPRTRAQVAVVTGGHQAVEPLVRAVANQPINATDWAPTVAALLGLHLPTAVGPLAAPELASGDLFDGAAPGVQAGHDRTAHLGPIVGPPQREEIVALRPPVERGHLAGIHDAALERERDLAAGREQRRVRRIGGEQVALGGDVPTNEVGDPRTEQLVDECAPVGVVGGVGAERPAVTRARQPPEVVHQAGDLELHVSRM